MATVDTAYVQTLLHFARARGLESKSLLEAVGFSAESIAEEHGRVPSAGLYALFDLLAERTDDDAVGLSIAAETEPDSGALAMVTYAATNAANIREVAERAAQLMSIVDDTNQMFLETDSDVFRYGVRGPNPPEGVNRYAATYSLSQQYGTARLIAVKPFGLYAAHFAHPAPTKNLAAYERAFPGAKILFDQPIDQLVVDIDILDRPVVGADPALGRLLFSVAQRRLQDLPDEDFLTTARREVVATLTEGASLELLAGRLRMGERTLQRRLKDEGVSHKSLVEQARRSMAERLLQSGRTTLADVAHLLGYSDSTAFARAFRRWFQTSPAAYQRAHAGAHRVM